MKKVLITIAFTLLFWIIIPKAVTGMLRGYMQVGSALESVILSAVSSFWGGGMNSRGRRTAELLGISKGTLRHSQDGACGKVRMPGCASGSAKWHGVPLTPQEARKANFLLRSG
jgi:hypothetical protein